MAFLKGRGFEGADWFLLSQDTAQPPVLMKKVTLIHVPIHVPHAFNQVNSDFSRTEFHGILHENNESS